MPKKTKRFYRFSSLLVTLACVLTFSYAQPVQIGLASPEGTIIRVATTGTDSSNCGGVNNPCKTIQYAVNNAGASGDVIAVAGGVYTYNPAADQCSWAITRAIVCIVDKNLTILGGYTTSNWAISDPVKYTTVIDGQNLRRGVMVIRYNTTASLVMDGFTIQNGLAQGVNNTPTDYDSRGFGAGIWSQKAPMTLRRMILSNNRAIGGNHNDSYGGYGAGGGIAIETDPNIPIQVSMENVLIENNQALGGSGGERGGLAEGGGVFAVSNAHVDLTDVVIQNNLANSGTSSGNGSSAGLIADALGGGVALLIGASADFERVQILNNQAIGGNAGSATGSKAGSGLGGGLYVEEAPVTIRDSIIIGNNAIGGAAAQGGLAFGGGIMINYADVTMERTWVVHNLANSGGSSSGGSAGLVSGGGIYMAAYPNPGQAHLTATNDVIADNQVKVGTPGIASLASGAGITIQAVTMDLIHCTLANNRFLSTGRAGQAISVEGSQGSGGVPATANIRYTIISDHINTTVGDGNTSALTVYSGSTANLNTVMFYNNTNSMNTNGRPVAHGTINQVNTRLATTPIGYVSPGAPNFNYHLNSTSPAIDQAITSTTSDDIDGQHRPFGPARDIGADEFIELDYSVYLPLTLR